MSNKENGMRQILPMLMLVALVATNCTEGSKAKVAVGNDVDSDISANDGRQVADFVEGEGVLADTGYPDTATVTDTTVATDTVTAPDSATDTSTGTDAVMDTVTALDTSTGTDSAQDVNQADVGILEPFAGCSEEVPCTHPDAPLCLLLPSLEGEGVCVKSCEVGGTDCPPWLECTAVSSEDPEFAVCLEVVEKNQPCSNVDGQVCTDGLYCAQKEGDDNAMCTTYCTIGETICPMGYDCTVLYADQPDWGACLPIEDLVVCAGEEECPEGTACVLVSEVSACVPVCPDPGEACGKGGTCVSLPLNSPDPVLAEVCVALGKAGELCALAKGLACQDDLLCTDVSSPDGFDRCLAPCQEGSCPAGSLCSEKEDYPGGGLCTPLAFVFPEPQACSDNYPCQDDDKVCILDGEAGLCLPSCSSGCPQHTTCVDGACMVAVPPHAPCNEDVGVLCMDPAVCITDPGKSGSGWCAPPCTPGQNLCSLGTQCIETTAGAYCLQTTGWGQLCALEHGIACDPAEGLKCIAVSPDSGWGYCSPECSGPAVGDCPDLGDAYVLCNFKQSGVWYCAFSCFGVQACPAGLECSEIGICMP